MRHWRYYTVHGAKLLSSVRDPEELHQWLEVKQFSKSLQQWHEKDVNIEGDLVPAKVLIIFRELVEKSIISCNLSSEFSVDRCKGKCLFSAAGRGETITHTRCLIDRIRNEKATSPSKIPGGFSLF